MSELTKISLLADRIAVALYAGNEGEANALRQQCSSEYGTLLEQIVQQNLKTFLEPKI